MAMPLLDWYKIQYRYITHWYPLVLLRTIPLWRHRRVCDPRALSYLKHYLPEGTFQQHTTHCAETVAEPRSALPRLKTGYITLGNSAFQRS
jgi:hypothetical protein